MRALVAMFGMLAVGLARGGDAPAAADAAARHLVTMHNGDCLTGAVTGFSPDGMITIAYPAAATAIAVKLTAVKSIEALDPPARMPPSPAVLVLADGDQLPCSVVGFGDDTLTINSPLIDGKSSVKWQDIRQIGFSHEDSIDLLGGPLTGQPWKFSKRATNIQGGENDKNNARIAATSWKFDRGGITGTGQGGASIDAKLPDKAEIDLEISSARNMPYIIGLFTDAMLPAVDGEPDGPKVMDMNGPGVPFREGLAIEISPQSIVLRHHSQGQGLDHLGSKRLPAPLRDKEKRKLKIRIDIAKGIIGVWDNGTLAGKWTDLGALQLKGKAISLCQQQGITGEFALRHFSVREWHGNIDDDAFTADDTKDVIIVKDGSRLTGKLLSLKGNVWHLRGGVGDLEIARANVFRILRATGASAPIDTKPRVQVNFGDGNVIHLTAPVLGDNGLLSGSHDPLGQVKLHFPDIDSIFFPVPAPANP